MTADRPRMGRRVDAGTAVVEFLMLGVLLLVPVAYLALLLGRVQAATYAADAAAREAARALVAAQDEPTGLARARTAVRLALLDQGFEVDPTAVTTLDCSASPCLTLAATVTVRVELDVVLPGVPAGVDRAVPTHVVVRARQTAMVDRFRAATAGG